MRIGLAFDLKESYVPRPGDASDAVSEWDSEETIGHIEGALRANGHEVTRLGGGLDLVRLAARGPLGVDLVFNVCEGLDGRGREAQVPAILELIRVPFTGSDTLTMAVSLDKAVAKRLLREHGVPTADFAVLAEPGAAAGVTLRYPVFVKPLHEGTGKGIAPTSIARDAATLRSEAARIVDRYRQPALVEEYLPGREFTVGILGNEPPRAIGTMEIVVEDPSESRVYSSSSKEAWETKVSYRYNGAIEAPLRSECERIAVAAFRALECRDFGRVDLRCDAEGRPKVLEVNPLAGLSPEHGDLCFLARESGIPYIVLIGRIVEEACRRCRLGVAA